MTTTMSPTHPSADAPTATGSPGATIVRPDPVKIRKAIARRSVAVLATTSASQRPHAATVLYQAVDDALYVSTSRSSRKARNVAGQPHVAVAIAVRRLPVGPPSSIQFQTTATILGPEDPEIRQLARAGRLDKITGHGELELPDACLLRLALPRRLPTYGLGMSLRRLITHPLDAAGEALLPPTSS